MTFVTGAAGLILGLLLGATIQRTHFCVMGAISDVVLFGSRRRLRSWALAVAVALAGTQALALAGLIEPAGSVYLSSRLPWLADLAGGLAFGFGMVLAGGCTSRNLARVGAGSLKALVVVVVTGIAAFVTGDGILSFVPHLLVMHGSVDLARHAVTAQSLGGLLDGVRLAAPDTANALLGLLLAAALAVWCLKDRSFRGADRELWGGLIIGALIPLGWLVTSGFAPALSEARVFGSLTFVVPLADTVASIVRLHLPSAFLMALVFGTIGGAFLAAKGSRQFRIERFASRGDLARHLSGSLLMGVGGMVALGCTVGQGITGLSTLAVGSMLATSAILVGAVWALRYLETGRLLAWLPLLGRGADHEAG